MRALLFTLPLLLTACAEFPEVAARVPEAELQGQPPALVPLESILTQARGPAAAEVEAIRAEGVLGRIAALRTRAAGLRGPVLSAPARARLARGVDLTPLN